MSHPNPNLGTFKSMEFGQCDGTTYGKKRCRRGAVEYQQHKDGQTYAVCRSHRKPGMFTPWRGPTEVRQ